MGVERALMWVVATDVLFLVAGIAAFETRLSLPVAAVLAQTVAIPALLDLRRSSAEEGVALSGVWADRAVSFLMGSLAVSACLVVVPYVTLTEDGGLWGVRAFVYLGLVAAAGGLALWNLAVVATVMGRNPMQRTWLVEVGALVVLLWAAWTFLAAEADSTYDLQVRGMEVPTIDVAWSALVVGLAGLYWGASVWRVRTALLTQGSVGGA